MSRPVIIYLFLQIFFDSILYYWEPQFHPLIREVVINIQVGCVLFAFFFTVLYLYVSMLHLKLIPFFQSHKDILKTIACDLVSAEEFVELEVCSFLYFWFCQHIKIWLHLVPLFSHWNHTRMISWSICSLMHRCILRERRKNLGYAISFEHCMIFLLFYIKTKFYNCHTENIDGIVYGMWYRVNWFEQALICNLN